MNNGPLTTDKVYLAGFMGAGKSTIGPLLAEQLQVPFIDLDAAIEAVAGCSIPEIFEAGGEKAFRRKEREALCQTDRYERAVVALGGGAVVSEENLAWVKTHGRLVYLRVPSAVLARRLEPEADGRPLLQDEEGAPYQGKALRKHIEGLLSEREVFYRRAHHVVEAAAAPEHVVRRMIRLLSAT